MTPKLKTLTAAIAAAALLAPAASAAKPTDKPAKAKTERTSKGKAKGHAKAKGQAKAKKGIFRGAVTAVDAGANTISVLVDGGNKRARNLAAGETVVFSLASVKKLHVADRDANGTVDVADFLAGDRVQVQALVGSELGDTVDARKVHNKTAPPVETEPAEGEEAEGEQEGEVENEG